jgi:hypothetical protein
MDYDEPPFFMMCLPAVILYNAYQDKTLTTLNDLIDGKQGSSRSCVLHCGLCHFPQSISFLSRFNGFFYQK